MIQGAPAIINTCMEDTRIPLTLAEYNKKQISWIEVHKWYLSQSAGYDVGFNAAATSWVKTGLAAEFRQKHKIVKEKE